MLVGKDETGYLSPYGAIGQYTNLSNNIFSLPHEFSVMPGFLGMAGGEDLVVKSSNWDSATPDSFYKFSVTPPLTDSLSAGGARLIGASLEIEYLGKVDDI